MSHNSELDALLQQVPVADLAKKFGVDEATVDAAVRQALPGLVGGMAVNARDDAGAAKLEKAVQKHTPKAGKLDLNAIDTDDGDKIVNHVLGNKKEDVALALGEQSGSSTISKLIPQLLPILAPLVMQFLAGKVGGGQQSGTSGGGLGGVLGDLVGGLFGGGSSQGSSQGSASSGGLGDILGGLLGGGSAQGESAQSGSVGGGLGDILGGLLGGKK